MIKSGPATFTPSSGGNVRFAPGKGYRDDVDIDGYLDGQIIFEDAHGNELVRLSGEGFFVEGRQVTHDTEVYEGFRKFLKTCRVTLGQGQDSA